MKNLDDKKESVINQSKETLRSWVNKIGEKAGELESMLKPVLGQELPERNPETDTPASDSPLAEDLNCISADAERVIRKLDNLITRVQC